MKRRGLTVVEVLIVVTIIGLIAAAFFPLLFFELKNLNRSYSFTVDAFEAQTLLEKQKLLLDEGKHVVSEWKPIRIKAFSGHEIDLLSRVVETSEKDIGFTEKYNREALIILPKERFAKKKLPVIKVTLNKKGTRTYEGNVTYTSEDDKKTLQFLVYRWYLGNISDMDPITKKADPSKLVMIREHNVAKNIGDPLFFIKPEQLVVKSEKANMFYKGHEFEVIAASPYAFLTGNPALINDGLLSDKLDGDRFKTDSINMKSSDSNNFNSDEMEKLYNYKGLVFSAMLVTKEGEVGEEIYSDMIDLGYKKEEHTIGKSTGVLDAGSVYGVKILLKEFSGQDDDDDDDDDDEDGDGDDDEDDDDGHEYSFFFRGKSDNKNYFPRYDDGLSAYLVSTVFVSKPEINVNNDGYALLDVFLPKNQNYTIYIVDGTMPILAGDIVF